jgi:AraC-like DNA-binding protein
MATDPLADLLLGLRFRGAVFYLVSGGEGWAASAPVAEEVAEALLPGLEHVMEYHFVVRGRAWAVLDGQEPVPLAEGEAVVFPQGDAHVMTSRPGLRPAPADPDWYRATREVPRPLPIHLRGLRETIPGELDPEAATVLACGFLGCDLRPFNPLISALPRLLPVPAGGAGEALRPVLTQAMAAVKAGQAGASAALDRLGELLLVEAVRGHLSALPAQGTGWLAALREAPLARALAALHADPAREWSVESLAAEAALSRSAFHERFAAVLGLPPMQYLTQWRLQEASRRLLESDDPVLEVALAAGYGSEAAFSRAFRRLTGSPPAQWRRRRRRGETSEGE